MFVIPSVVEEIPVNCLAILPRDPSTPPRSAQDDERSSSGEDRNRTYPGPGYAGTDNGFEDREDHQAPFTLRIADCELRIAKRLFCFFDRRDNGVEVRPIAGVEFGME